jgi:hypothetical protein
MLALAMAPGGRIARRPPRLAGWTGRGSATGSSAAMPKGWQARQTGARGARRGGARSGGGRQDAEAQAALRKTSPTPWPGPDRAVRETRYTRACLFGCRPSRPRRHRPRRSCHRPTRKPSAQPDAIARATAPGARAVVVRCGAGRTASDARVLPRDLARGPQPPCVSALNPIGTLPVPCAPSASPSSSWTPRTTSSSAVATPRPSSPTIPTASGRSPLPTMPKRSGIGAVGATGALDGSRVILRGQDRTDEPPDGGLVRKDTHSSVLCVTAPFRRSGGLEL